MCANIVEENVSKVGAENKDFLVWYNLENYGDMYD